MIIHKSRQEELRGFDNKGEENKDPEITKKSYQFCH